MHEKTLIKEIIVEQGLDEKGEPNEFTSDLTPMIDYQYILHLNGYGLPKPGVQLWPGMILVGLLGKTKNFHKDKIPNCLEYHTSTDQELKKLYDTLYINNSKYVDLESHGKVIDAKIHSKEDRTEIAIITIEQETELK